MHKIFLSALFFICFFACSAKEPASVKKNIESGLSAAAKDTSICPAPTAFQDVDRMMKSPGYWVSKLPDPDKVILNTKKVEAINARTNGKSIYLTDIQHFPSKIYRKNASSVYTKLVSIFSKYYDSSDRDRKSVV